MEMFPFHFEFHHFISICSMRMHKPICSVTYRPVSMPPTLNESELNSISFSTQSRASALLWQRCPSAQNCHQDTHGTDIEQRDGWRDSNCKTKRVTDRLASLASVAALPSNWNMKRVEVSNQPLLLLSESTKVSERREIKVKKGRMSFHFE